MYSTGHGYAVVAAVSHATILISQAMGKPILFGRNLCGRDAFYKIMP